MQPIHTARLILRPFVAGDLAALTAMHQHPDVYRWLGDGHAPTAAATAARLEYYRQPLDLVAKTKETRQELARLRSPHDDPARLLGTILLKPVPLSQGEYGATEYEIGWHLHPAHWGNGYATEAAQAMLLRARMAKLRQVVAVTYPDNWRSQAVMQRLGMTKSGMTRRYYDTDTLLFTLQLSQS